MKPDNKQSGRELDEQLRNALREEDAELLARLDTDPGIFETVREGFRGSTAWWVWLTSVIQLVIFGIAVWTAVRFFSAETIDDRVLWGIPLIVTWIMAGMLKMMVWNHVERGMLRREIKRVELQVATLSLRLKDRV